MVIGSPALDSSRQEEFIYTTGRVVGQLVRPLFLWVANNYLSGDAAQGLAIIFLGNSLALVASNTDPHRRFYSRAFGSRPASLGLFFSVYSVSLLLLSFAGAMLVAGMASWRMQSILLAVAAAFYFITEKIADEILRFSLFQKSFKHWGSAMLFRSGFQVLLLVLCIVIWKSETQVWTIVIALAIGNGLVFFPKIPGRFWELFTGPRKPVFAWLVSRSVRTMWSDVYPYWLIGILGTLIAYLDRLLTLFIDQAILPLFMLVVMSFSAVQMCVDFFFLSRHRPDFLRGSLRVKEALISLGFLRSLFGGLVLGGLICAAVLVTSRNRELFALNWILAILLIQGTVAMTMIPREISYWLGKVRGIILIDAAACGLALIGVALGIVFDLSLNSLLFLIVTCSSMRLVFHVKLADRLSEKSVSDTTQIS